MSGLGKILIVLNLLAAGAFLYFSTENWQKRQDLTFAEFRGEVQRRGLPVAPPAATGELDADSVSFVYAVNQNTNSTFISKATLAKLIPPGGEFLGGEPVADQTAEVKRVRDKVMGLIAAADGPAKTNLLRTYTLNLARGGAERDGVNAVFDVLAPDRASLARPDLPYAARTSSQVAALKALVDVAALGDPQTITPAEAQTSKILGARDAVARLIKGEIGHGAGGGADGEENARKLANAVVDAAKPGAGDAAKQNLATAAPGDPDGFKHLADLAVNPLSTKANVEAARASVLEYVLGKAGQPAEKTALTELVNLIAPGADFKLAESVTNAATALLTQKFEEAEAPAAEGKDAKGNNPEGEKARRIAHILYHIDTHRVYDNTAAEDRKAWHARVVTVVGLTEYVRAAELQATEYSEAANRLLAVITEEQSAFESEYQTRVQRALFLYSQWATVDAQLKQQVAITDENKRLLAERVTERDKLKDELEKGQEAAKESLAKLKTTQESLFKVQKDLRNAQEALLSLEKELRRLELGS